MDKSISSNKDRNQLIEEINDAGRRMSTVTVLFHESIAEYAGLSGSDHKYLDILLREGAMTAGNLANLTGLTSGAITGIIDRLEEQNFVERERSLEDRRKVLITPNYDYAMKILGPVFEKLQSGLEKFLNEYSDEELLVINRYLNDTIIFFENQIKNIKEN